MPDADAFHEVDLLLRHGIFPGTQLTTRTGLKNKGSALKANVRTRPLFPRLLSTSYLALALATHAHSLQAQQPYDFANQVESIAYPGPGEAKAPPLAPRRAGRPPRPYTVLLDPVSAAKAAAETGTPQRQGTPLKIGFGREITELGTAEKTVSRLNWEDMPQGGKMAAISITSPQAKGLRLGILILSLPANAVLRFYSQKGDAAVEVTGAEILKLIKTNLDAGDNSDNARTYWSPHIESEEVTVEIDLPPGVDPNAVSIAIPRTSHMFRSFMAPQSGNMEKSVGSSASCELDVSCYSSAWGSVSNATAQMSYVSSIDGGSYVCSGTLLNNTRADYTPYFLSADHCISSQTTASTLNTVWFYRSMGCTSSIPNPDAQLLSSGATLLYASANTDTSFMRLNGAPPSGAVYAGWMANAQSAGAAVTGIHHPQGDLQKISFGALGGFESCTAIDPATDAYNCSPSSSGNFLAINFSAGIVEGGSSGSGLFVTSGGSHYLVGQMLGYTASCGNPSGRVDYGRFDFAYFTALTQWLNPDGIAPDVLLKEYLYKDGSYFYSAVPAEQQVVESGQLGPGWAATGNNFNVWMRKQPAGSYPVCRFRGDNITVSGWGHFYTALPSECTAVRNGSAPFWLYDGIGFYAYLPSGTCPAGTITIYRQYNPVLHNHHFQTSNQLSTQMQAAGWTMEGIPFCVGM